MDNRNLFKINQTNYIFFKPVGLKKYCKNQKNILVFNLLQRIYFSILGNAFNPQPCGVWAQPTNNFSILGNAFNPQQQFCGTANSNNFSILGNAFNPQPSGER